MDSPAENAEVVDWLRQPTSYPHAPSAIEVVETHISYVFLAGQLAYKLKKPLRFDFLDFSTVDRRQRACEDELRLNRRLAPDAYLDVVPVVRTPRGDLQLGGEGEQLDWLVVMRRLPTDQSLEALYQRNELRPEHIDRLAEVLADFYRSLAPLSISPDMYRSRYVAHVRDNRQVLLGNPCGVPVERIKRIHSFQLQHLLLRPELFDERVVQGRVVEGHGDLRPEHICLTEPPIIFDCIEFSADFRRIDVADELAFLTAECDFLGADWVGPRLLDRLGKLTGDRPACELFDFYKSYRACVRAKVAALRASQLYGADQAAAADKVERHLELADRYASAWQRPLVLVVGGLSGTGKTTLAHALAEELGADLLRTDTLRQELFDTAGTERQKRQAIKDGGIYEPKSRQRVYDALLERAREMNAAELSVVLDGTFSCASQVEAARQSAAARGSRFLAIECTCRPDVARQRIRQRSAAGLDASDAWEALHDMQRAAWQPWPDHVPTCRVNTEQPLAEQVQQSIDALRHATCAAPH